MRLQAENLVKQYKKRRVVNDMSLEVEQGEIVGLLGPNGAGENNNFLYDRRTRQTRRGRSLFR